MNHITIVSSPSCSYCHAAKQLLQKQGMEYEEIDLLKNAEQAQQLMLKSGRRTVPQIFINDTAIGGYSELTEKIANNEIDLNPTNTH